MLFPCPHPIEMRVRGNANRPVRAKSIRNMPERPLKEDARALYHAGAAIASNYLVTLYRAASRLFEDAGAPPEGLVPLMTRTIENGFELTGPIARGDWETVERHREALRDTDFEGLYEALAEATRP